VLGRAAWETIRPVFIARLAFVDSGIEVETSEAKRSAQSVAVIPFIFFSPIRLATVRQAFIFSTPETPATVRQARDALFFILMVEKTFSVALHYTDSVL
jgi:hypothetical protein